MYSCILNVNYIAPINVTRQRILTFLKRLCEIPFPALVFIYEVITEDWIYVSDFTPPPFNRFLRHSKNLIAVFFRSWWNNIRVASSSLPPPSSLYKRYTVCFFQGFEHHRNKVVYSKKQDFYSDSGELKNSKKYDDFDALFDQHMESYEHSDEFLVSTVEI